jgi:hypothetical protein
MITPEDIQFKSCEGLFSKVRRDLSSFDAAGMIDEGEFPTYVKHVLKTMGLSVYKETSAVVPIKNYKAKLPEDFTLLHAAWKCSPYVEAEQLVHLQGQGVSVYHDVTWELIEGSSKCEIEAVRNSDDRVLEKVTVRQYVKDNTITIDYRNPVLLRLSPNVKKSDCSDDCENVLSSSIHEISIRNGQILTNFTNDCVYLQYYAFPKDEDGVPMIPDLEWVEKAIEWHIKAEVLKVWWFNNSVPDIEKRWQVAEAEYEKWLSDARFERKHPGFEQMINAVRRKRTINKISLFIR